MGTASTHATKKYATRLNQHITLLYYNHLQWIYLAFRILDLPTYILSGDMSTYLTGKV